MASNNILQVDVITGSREAVFITDAINQGIATPKL